MIEIKGIYNTAICFTDEIEDQAYEQIKHLCDSKEYENSKIRIMPDVHAGKGCTIGSTITFTNKINPLLIGVDIACGMYVVELGKQELDLEALDKFIHENIKAGSEANAEPLETFNYNRLRCIEHLKNLDHIKNSLGSLGGGNHFIEIDESKDGTKYLIIHSGSRNLGKQVAEYYHAKSIEYVNGTVDLQTHIQQIIRDCKATGLEKKIQTLIEQAKADFKEKQVEEDNCYLEGYLMNDYICDATVCSEYAIRNRELMAEKIVKFLGFGYKDSFHVIHNYIDYNKKIIRKGAISAEKDQRVLIPLSMNAGCILGKGLGNEDWNCSAPHGAGRKTSRIDARESFSLSEYKQSMEGIYSTCVNESTIDEAPMAYKNPLDIIESIKETVEITDILKPIYNFKATK